MFWNKKKDNRLPDLPPSPQFPLLNRPPAIESYEQPEEIHELPSFPDSPMQRGFSQAAIKQAISQDEDETANNHELPSLPEIHEAEEFPVRQSIEISSRESKPVFVRIDKFQAAKSSLENIKIKLADIENMLKQIQQVKLKEEQEISSWEADINNIKSRIQQILSEIFEKQEY